MNETNKPNLSDLKIDSQARSNDGGGRRLMLIAAAILVTIAVIAIFIVGGTSVTTVEVAIARVAPTGGTATVLNASGYVEPRRKATVSSKITGKVIEVLVDEGMVVEEGQILAQLDDSDARRRYEAIRAERDVARAAIEELEVNLADSERTLRRINELRDQGVASVQDLDSATAAVDALRAKLRVSRSSLDAAEAQLAVSAQDLENYTVRAPFAGIAVSKDAQPGEMVSPVSAGGGFTRTGISTIVDMESLEIEVDVNESHIAKVTPGQPADAVLDAYPEWHIPATVRTVIPTADRQKATVKVRLTFDELDPRILPDMGVKVAFRETVQDEATANSAQSLVPQPSVRTENGQTVVFVVEDETVDRRAVSVGRSIGNDIEIIAGVTPGDRVVVSESNGLTDGQKVKVKS
ncbi:MAG: efflux RND transporter periplasmic adaptor subunit [Acidobacteriota bacterium]|jgi:RND family efflux transporter MFP subunit|nr:efflux RND transporter periplasmic adaptor subunit [Acidobacteriota bacterium]